MPRRYLPLLILLVVLLSLYVDLGRSIPIKLKLGNWKFERTFEKPLLNFDLLGTKIYRDWEFKRGLDLAGGTQLTLAVDMGRIGQADRASSIESLQGVIERRVNLLGVSEPVVQTARNGNDYRLIVEIPGVTDTAQAVSLVGQTAQLSFREEISASVSGKIATAEAAIFGPFQVATALTGKDLKKAAPTFDSQNGQPTVQLIFTDEGAKKFEEITRRNIGKRLAIFLDNQVLMAPTVQTAISGGTAVVTGQFTPQQTKEFSILLNSGALPAPVKVIEQRTVGATLGDESVRKSLVAGVLGLVVIFLFMLGNYKKLGFLASLALLVYTLIVMAIFKLLPVTLTLAGIAGFILSIGMAVDANILIFERIKEEIRWGRGQISAVELGFTRAFPSIRDSNASSLLTCGILYWFGSGPIRGFAVTLAIGILVSLFSAVTVTRTLLRITTIKNQVSNIKDIY